LISFTWRATIKECL